MTTTRAEGWRSMLPPEALCRCMNCPTPSGSSQRARNNSSLANSWPSSEVELDADLREAPHQNRGGPLPRREVAVQGGDGVAVQRVVQVEVQGGSCGPELQDLSKPEIEL